MKRRHWLLAGLLLFVAGAVTAVTLACTDLPAHVTATDPAKTCESQALERWRTGQPNHWKYYIFKKQ